MEFLLMAIGHNLRKMAAKGGNPKKIAVKTTKQNENGLFTIEISLVFSSKSNSLKKSNKNCHLTQLAA